MRLTLATLFSAALIFAAVFAGYVFLIGSAIAFSGSTGERHRAFVGNFMPLLHFVSGAVFGGVLTTLTNALFADRGWWVRLIILVSLVGGMVALLNTHVAEFLISLAQPLMHLFALLFLRR